MSLFTFDSSHKLGAVRAVDTRRVSVQVDRDEDLRKARVGQLVAISLPGPLPAWLIGIIDRVVKTPALRDAVALPDAETDGADVVDPAGLLPGEITLNTVRLTLVGTVDGSGRFSRSLVQVPEIDAQCHVLRDAQLQRFMGLLSKASEGAQSLAIGRYTIDEKATAYIDGNKLFQRHASLLGSTGSGKSWAVAAILEQAAKLPSANLVVFDLHGEYRELSYARHLRIPGPDELESDERSLLFLPYWLLNAEELQAMFIDRSERTAHNQVTAFQEIVLEQKREALSGAGRQDMLNSLTLNSPVPFGIEGVLREIDKLNTQMVEGSRTPKQGPFFGHFDRLLVRMKSRTEDKRYGFLFGAPKSEHAYDAMSGMIRRLLGHSGDRSRVKVIDFSEVPSDVLPVMVGLVARIIYQTQFWTSNDARQPVALVCDEAHLYLPKRDDADPTEQRAVHGIERIAKEGRKYGLALLIVSQRPSDVSPTVLSQCNNVIALRLTNGEDQATVKRLMPESLEGFMDALPVLDTGEALVVGDSVLLPSRIRIAPPNEKPCSATVDFWDEWSEEKGDPDFNEAVESMRRQNRVRPS